MRKNEAKWIEKAQRWQINVQKNGVRRTFVDSDPGRKGKINAERKADLWLKEELRDTRLRFNDAYAQFLDYTELHFSKSTYSQREYIGRVWIAPRLKNKRLSIVVGREYQLCIDAAYKAGLARKTLYDIAGCMTAFFSFAEDVLEIQINRPKKFIIPNDAPTKDKRILQPDNLQILFDKDINDFYIFAVRFIVVTGLRCGELCGIMNKDRKGNLLQIQRSVTKFGEVTDGKTKNAKRTIVLSQMACDIWDNQISLLEQRGIESDFIFPNRWGDRLNSRTLYKYWAKFSASHGFKTSLHELRHTYISVMKGHSSEALLKQVVGHSKSMDTFGVYGHAVDGELQTVANDTDAAFASLLGEK